MHIKITKAGELFVNRGHGFKVMCCPFQNDYKAQLPVACGDSCLLFSEFTIETSF